MAYQKRKFMNFGVQPFDGVQLKLYTISAASRAASLNDKHDDLIKTGLEKLASKKFSPRGLGYAMLHKGEDADWLLVRLWLEGDIVAGVMAGDYGKGFDWVTEPFVECIWEHLVARHERDAWVRHMMSKTPKPTAYLEDVLPHGMY